MSAARGKPDISKSRRHVRFDPERTPENFSRALYRRGGFGLGAAAGNLTISIRFNHMLRIDFYSTRQYSEKTKIGKSADKFLRGSEAGACVYPIDTSCIEFKNRREA